jgi:ABC-2 type transport system ATP-binding protein
MLQDGGFDPRSRPLETLREFAGYHAGARDPDELVDLLGLRAVADTPYRRLSGGERQRLSLAVALAGRPEVLVLDEPTAGLDPEARVAVRGIVADARAEGAAILLTSHDLSDVERLADRIVVIAAGSVVAAGTPSELATVAGSGIRFRVARLLTPDEVDALERRVRAVAALAEARVEHGPEPGHYRIDADAALLPAAVAALAAGAAEAGLAIAELRTGGGSLEEAYLALVAGEHAP